MPVEFVLYFKWKVETGSGRNSGCRVLYSLLALYLHLPASEIIRVSRISRPNSSNAIVCTVRARTFAQAMCSLYILRSPNVRPGYCADCVYRLIRVCAITSILRRATTKCQNQVKSVAAFETVLFGRLVVVPMRRRTTSVYVCLGAGATSLLIHTFACRRR